MILSTLALLLAGDFPTYVDRDGAPVPPDAPRVVMGMVSGIALIGAVVALILLTVRYNRERGDKGGTNPPLEDLRHRARIT